MLDNEIKRLQPRPNADVNQHWMCDEGRLNHRYVGSPRRLLEGTGTGCEIAESGRGLKFGGVISTYQTIEEMHLFRKLMEALKAVRVGFLTGTQGERQVFPGGFVIEADKTPNRAYAEKVFGAEAVRSGVKWVVEGIESGDVDALLVMNGIPDLAIPAELLAAAKTAKFLAVSDLLQGPLAQAAHVVIPGMAWAEKDGTFMNVDGRVQRVRKAVEPPVAARPEVQWLQEALVALGERKQAVSAEGVFREAMPGLDYGKVGSLGVKANGTHA